MNLQSSDSLILKEMDFKEHDKIITFLTKDRGEKSGVVRGTKKMKSHHLGVVEPFTHVQIHYVEKPHVELVQVRKFDVYESFYGIRQNYDRILHATYFTELIHLCEIDPEEAWRFFQLLLTFLHDLQQYQNFNELKILFEKSLFSLLGLSPNMEQCCHCHQTLWNSNSKGLPQLLELGTYQMDCNAGQIRCPNCLVQSPNTALLSPGTLAFWKAIQSTNQVSDLKIRATQRNIHELDLAFSLHFRYHIGKSPKSHALLKAKIPQLP